MIIKNTQEEKRDENKERRKERKEIHCVPIL
jgi:hypothetical protein